MEGIGSGSDRLCLQGFKMPGRIHFGGKHPVYISFKIQVIDDKEGSVSGTDFEQSRQHQILRRRHMLAGHGTTSHTNPQVFGPS